MAGHRLSEAQRREIAEARAVGVPATTLAARFGVTRRTVANVVRQAQADGPASPSRTVVVSLRVAREELAAFDAALAAQGLTRTEGLRRLMRGAREVFVPRPEEAGQLQRLSAALSRVGANVNQIARGINEARVRGERLPDMTRSDADLRELAQVVLTLSRQVNALARSRRGEVDLAVAAAFGTAEVRGVRGELDGAEEESSGSGANGPMNRAGGSHAAS